MKVTGIIISRKGSRRLKNKMYKKFFGKSLIENKIKQLLKSNVDEVIVGSDDTNLKKLCEKLSIKKEVIFVKRDKKYCDEISTTPNQMIKNMLSLIKTDIVLWAHLTNPFVNENHYNEALNIYFKKKKFDSLFAVTKLSDYFWDQNKKPLNHNPNEKSHTLISSGKIKSIFVDNGSIFIRSYKDMIKDGRFWGKKGYMYEMSEQDGWDINMEWDLEACQLKSFKKNKRN